MPASAVIGSGDAYVNEAQPGDNFGQQTRLRLRGSGSSHHKRALIFFKPPNPLESVVLFAKLHVHLKGGWSGSQTITVDRIIETWNQGHVTWNNQPNQSGLHEVTKTVTDGSDGDEVVIDVSDMIQDVAFGQPYYGLRLSFEGSTDVDRDLHSVEAPTANARPWLEVKWTPGPSAPTNLSPAGGRAVTAEAPVLSWKFNDSIGEAFQIGANVQVSVSTDFSSPIYDASNFDAYPSWDLAADPDFPGMSPGDIVYWRVKVVDDSGVSSPWSDVAQFQRQERSVLTLVNPAEAPDNFVDELTPPIDWTFTGTATQQHVLLYEVISGHGWTSDELIYRFQNIDGTSVKVPLQGAKWSGGKFPGLKTGRLYKVVVRVWDDQDRESTPGDPAYQEVTREFTYHREGSPSPVPSLTAVADGPSIILTWTRSTEPDFFGLRAKATGESDFTEVVNWIDPEDVFVSGTTYSYRYWGTEIGVETTYEVEAVVKSGGTKYFRSDGNATDHVKAKAMAAWLVDVDDGTFVEILGTEQPDIAVGSSGTTYDPLGSRKPVRIIDNVRGLEGSVSGILLQTTDRDTFLDLYGRLKELRLIISDVNIPIEFDEPPTISPAPEGIVEGFNVSFSFFQSDEFRQTVGLRGS